MNKDNLTLEDWSEHMHGAMESLSNLTHRAEVQEPAYVMFRAIANQVCPQLMGGDRKQRQMIGMVLAVAVMTLKLSEEKATGELPTGEALEEFTRSGNHTLDQMVELWKGRDQADMVLHIARANLHAVTTTNGPAMSAVMLALAIQRLTNIDQKTLSA